MKLSVIQTGIVLAGVLCLLSACAPKLTYEATEWRVAAMSSDDASVVVRYVGVVSPKTNATTRQEVAMQLRDFIGDTKPGSPYTPRLRNATRRAYVEGNKLVVEESGVMNNPLSWSEQSGLNPFTWFRPSMGLTETDRHIVKRGIPPDTIIIASNGHIVDTATYAALYSALKAVEDRGYDRAPAETYASADRLEVIVWPLEASHFYWKLSGPGYEKNWLSLTPDLRALPPPEATEAETPAEKPAAETAGKAGEPAETEKTE
jgi:hypothetical protein